MKNIAGALLVHDDARCSHGNIGNFDCWKSLLTLAKSFAVFVTWIGIAARSPLLLALGLHARVCGVEIDIIVVVAEKDAYDRGANICSVALDIDGIIALTVSLDPLSCGPLTYAPGRVILRASLMILD